MAYIIQKEILNELLGLISKSKQIDIRNALRTKYKILDEDVVKIYEKKLRKDGLIIYRLTFPTATKYYHLTVAGVKFYKQGGYVTNFINHTLERKKRLKNLDLNKQSEAEFLGFIKALSGVNIKPKIKSKMTNIIIDNKNQIEDILIEIEQLFNKIETVHQISISEINRYDKELISLFQLAFLKEHKLFDDKRYTVMHDKNYLLGFYKPFYYELNHHLTGLMTDLPSLHNLIREKVEKLINEENNNEAVLFAFKMIEIIIREKTNNKKFGMELMNEIFSSKNPVIKFSNDENEQSGFMFLFKGAMGAVKNIAVHKDFKPSNEEAIELVYFASYLLRLLDKK